MADSDITSKIAKDVLFSVVTLATITVMIFHYVWILRKWLHNLDISYLSLTVNFTLFGLVCFILIKLLLRLYFYLYKEELDEANAQEKVSTKKQLKKNE